jgi:hypothetical protein
VSVSAHWSPVGPCRVACSACWPAFKISKV